MREVGFQVSGEFIGQVLAQVLGARPDPRHGSRSRIEFQSRVPEGWAYRGGGQLDFIWPGKPVENVFIESFDRRLCDECLNMHQFASMAEAQTIIEAWGADYNAGFPHSSLGT